MNALRPFLTASWRDLAVLNYEVSASLLRPLVPTGTELDDFDGTMLATLVGFRFLDTRVLGIPVPGHRDFRRGQPSVLRPTARGGRGLAARRRFRARAGTATGHRAGRALVLQRALLGGAHAPRAGA